MGLLQVWKQLAGMRLVAEDLHDTDVLYSQSLRGIADIHEEGVTSETFHDVSFALLFIR